ncbi:hypothetical protein E1281_28760 [Actinomadura sp. KC345]|uniref:hypothetical protein n=1 Tax=Actinomadura sp. KC345 TaxID=2530371 RepID=UPI001047899E|nr:hypothetical protein [Actinomadura sp. KC345]TDC46072.1 hypothetical protein E1281_28760 [Actinomadura sp. KC345]
MREPHRPSPPVARLLVVALGLLGFVAGPAGSGTPGGTSSTGTISAVRAWVGQHTSPRNRAAAKPRTGGHAKAAVGVPKRHAVTAASPDELPAPAVAAPPGSGMRPPPMRALRVPPAASTSRGLAPAAVPRGRAPPAPARI